MLILFCNLFLKKVLTQQTLYPLRGLVSIVLLLILNTGCSQLQSTVQQIPALLPNLSSDATFKLRVTPLGRSGVYTVAGSTNLPDKSRITIAAVRHLRPNQPLSPKLTPNLTYSILAYQDVKVNKGKWQAILNLWKTSPDGQFKEVWQLEQSKLGLKFAPEPEVTFVATVDPITSLSRLEQQLGKQGIKLVSSVVRNTTEGEQYVQAIQVLPISLPTGKTTPPLQRLEDINGGWGPRFLLIPEPQNTNKFEQPSKRRTNTPLSPAELLQ